MKILVMSNGPMAGTGYGVQCALLIDRLCRDGHDVAVACSFGNQVGVKEWTTSSGFKIRLYPSRNDPTGADIVAGHAQHFFDGEKRGGWIITLTDTWAVNNPMLAEFNVAAWVPVDHVTVPPAVHEFFAATGAVPIAMSRHGEVELNQLGLETVYIPLAVDIDAYKPTFEIQGISSRSYFDLPHEAFVVGMVAMNKGWVLDRKGFSEAFYAFGEFRKSHPDAVLFLHTDKVGFDGLNLTDLAFEAGIPKNKIVYSNAYAYAVGFTTEMMAAAYTSMDVLLAPSHGEGFCVPMIEAMACGVPCIASKATAQLELIGPGWGIEGQRVWDQSQRSPAFMPLVEDIIAKLEEAHTADLTKMQDDCKAFAAQYNADLIYDTYWRPFIATLEPPVNEPKPLMDDVAVIVPVMARPQNVKPLIDSFNLSNDGSANLYFVADADDAEELAALDAAGAAFFISERGPTYAHKANTGYAQTTESFIALFGDDVEFTPGWIEAARKVSERYDVIGTNDSEEGRVRNPEVAAGRHADHFLIRRSYIDDEGSCLEGPGVLAPEAYNHWYTDKEIIALARARGVFTPCLDSRVIHHHPGFDGREDLREADKAYMRAAEYSEADRTQFVRRLPLIEQQRVARGR